MERTVQMELQQIKGVGEVLAQRLVEAGFDSFARVAEAGEEGLKSIRGLNPRMIPTILEQARELSAGEPEIPATPDARLVALQETAARLQKRVQELTEALRESQGDKPGGKKEERLEKEVSRLLKGLERVGALQGIRIKKARKGLTKTEKRLDSLTTDGCKGLRRGLKKARKPLKRIWA